MKRKLEQKSNTTEDGRAQPKIKKKKKKLEKVHQAKSVKTVEPIPKSKKLKKKLNVGNKSSRHAKPEEGNDDDGIQILPPVEVEKPKELKPKVEIFDKTTDQAPLSQQKFPLAALLRPQNRNEKREWSVPGHVRREDKRHSRLLKAAEQVSQALRAFSLSDQLPLSVTGVHFVSPILRKTSVVIPRPYQHSQPESTESNGACSVPDLSNGKQAPSWCPSLNILISLEASGKWPPHLEAIQYLKTAFYLKMAELLRKEYQLITTAKPNYMDICFAGYVFRIKILNEREIPLHIQKDTEGKKKSERSVEVNALEEEFIVLPKHSRYIHSLVRQHEYFSPVCRLTKRWVGAHMLSDFVREEFIELAVACLLPFQDYRSGFQKVLNLFATFDWVKHPLIINFNDEFSSEDRVNMKEKFLSSRPTLPPISAYNPADLSGVKWTKPNPTPIIVDRLKNLASASLHVLSNPDSKVEEFDPTTLFRTSLAEYDVVIRLKSDLLPQRLEQWAECRSKPKAESEVQKIPVTNFDPALLYLRDLRDAFDHFALFFHDRYGGDAIGVLWKPISSKTPDTKISSLPGRKLSSNGELIVNKEAIVSDFKYLGKNIVESVQVNR